MHKIKKGIKKKIKGKKEKNDELFTPEELERYKKQKEEEARRLAEQQQQEEEEENQQEEPQQEPVNEAAATAGSEGEETASNGEQKPAASGGKEDWRNFFTAADTVLKETTDNLQHIKEVSYFQKKEEKVESVVVTPTAAAVTPVAGVAPAPSAKNWVDLEHGGFDDEEEVAQEEPAKEEEVKEEEPKPEVELKPLELEDLPTVDFDDFAEVFDTTYVDNVESGEVKLHYIPDSPTTEYANEPDPFDTSVVDKVLHPEEPEPKEKKAPVNQKVPEKKKKKLVSLGCAVEVLTGKVQAPEKTTVASVDSKKRRVVPQEVDLLADFDEPGEPVTTEVEEGEKAEKNLLDELLSVEDTDAELPELGAVLSVTPRAVTPVPDGETDGTDVKVNEGVEGENKEVDLSEFLETSGDDQDSKETKQENDKDLDLKDLVAEFDIIDKSEVTNETLIPTEENPIEDEFDAEFAFLAAESVAKSKEKEFEDLEDDPFDTSVAAQVLGPEETSAEKDPFDVSFVDGVIVEETTQKVKPTKPPPPRPAAPVTKEEAEIDPFDTSIAEKYLPVDHLASPDVDTSLPDALKPQAGDSVSKSESFDPFDTTIAESFGKTELKVLESELLTTEKPQTNLTRSDSDFDFNPREEEEPKPAPCLLTNTEDEDTSAPVLAPSQDALTDDFDPFDTSIAAKVEIQTLEAEFLTEEKPQEDTAATKKPPPRPAASAIHLLATTPTDTNPSLQPASTTEKTPADDDFDPFDTSIAENFGKTELKALENELLTSQETARVANQVPNIKPNPKELTLPVKPVRPPSPRCLLGATPLDENPALQPVLQLTAEASTTDPDDFDPFDTSIAEQFGTSELKELESELLAGRPATKIEQDDSFDPRAKTPTQPAKPSRPARPLSPAHPQCLLTATPSPTAAPPNLGLLIPSEPNLSNDPVSSDFDPFDTSIAEKFGKAELKAFESELLTSGAHTSPDPFDDFDPRAEESRAKTPQGPPPPRPLAPPAPCLLAATPTDSSLPLQPYIDSTQELLEGDLPEDFDPFDTSIADKLGKTEIKFLEESLLTKEENNAPVRPNLPTAALKTSTGQKSEPEPVLTPDRLLAASPTPDLGPTLQPTSGQIQLEEKEFDPFDTSIADTFGKTELKTLESELLADSGVKRDLSDNEFDPREEEIKAPKRPSPPLPKPATPVNLLDSADDQELTDQPIAALQTQSLFETVDDYDPFDTSIAADIGPSKQELKYLESNIKNPFLFDDPAPPADAGDAAVNPFLNGGAFDYSATSYTGINPFSDQIDDSNAAAAGLFGDPGMYPTDMNPFGIVPDASQAFGAAEPQPQADLFGGPVPPMGQQADFFGGPVPPMDQQADLFGGPAPQMDKHADLFGGPVPPMDQPEVDLFGEAIVPVVPPASHPSTGPPPVPPAPQHVPTHSPVPPARPPAPAPAPVDLMSDGPGIEEAHAVPGRPPPPRPPPPSKETKDLLQTVIGAMEDTTDKLHEKLETTRTPCPSPGSVGASPSPNPDIQVTAPEKESDSFSAIFGQTIDEDSDHDGEEPQASPTPASEPSTNTEDIDLFGDVPTQKQKSKQDIMSLFNQPQSQSSSQVDLLSGDLLSENNSTEGEPATQIKPAGEIAASENQKVDLLAGDETSETAALATTTEKEAASTDALSGNLHMTPQGESLPVEESVSPEQMSEQTDSEPTVIEAHLQGANEEANKISVLESEAQDSASMNEEKVEEVFGSPEPIPPAINANQGEQNETASKLDTSETPDQANAVDEAEKVPDNAASDHSKADSNEFIGTPPSTTTPPQEAKSHPETDAFGVVDSVSAAPIADAGAGLFGDTSTPFSQASGDALFGDSQEIPPASPAAGLFGDSQEIPPASPAAGLFGDSQEIPPASPATGLFGDFPPASSGAGLFGDISEEVPPASPATSLFGDVSNAVPPASPSANLFGDTTSVPVSSAAGLFGDTSEAAPQVSHAAGLFGDTPAAGSSGFDIFGDATSVAPAPAPAGADSTGAALFGTASPAPNVGMSLFGAGNEATLDIFAESDGNTMVNPFAPATPIATPKAAPTGVKVATDEEFDAFSARFEKVTEDNDLHTDPFAAPARAASPWGGDGGASGGGSEGFGFGDSAGFDSFLAMNEPPPVPQTTPRKAQRQTSGDSDYEPMQVVIKPAALDAASVSPRGTSPVPVLAPPPAVAANAAFTDTAPRFNPFDRGPDDLAAVAVDPSVTAVSGELQRTDSQETPPTPLFEEDQSQPLEDFPRTQFPGPVWEMHLRQPNKKKITGQRFWKKVFVKLTEAGCLQLFNNQDDKDPFQELPLQACYSVSDIGAQQFDQFGKIFTVKVQYIFYKERPGVRPGQMSKAERLTTKLSKFAHHAIAGDYEHVKEFASDVRKLGMPVEHAPQISQLLKLGTQAYEDLKIFSSLVEEQLFKITVHRDRALTYKSEEVQLTAVDEIYVEQDASNVVHRMIARVRIFFLGFLSGMPEVDLGINDMRKQGREVVGRHDIIPVITEEWIRLEAVEFHCCVEAEEFDNTKHIKFKPPDACYIELMRFRVRPPKNRELPLQVKTKVTIQGRKVDINSEILVPGFSGRKLGQVPCEDVMVRFPLPECWIYMFRVEKHFRYGSVKSAHRRMGKVKGMERMKGVADHPEAALMEVTSGQAKYEHQHRAIVWRMARLPKEGQGAYTMHTFSCKMHLTPYDQMPESLDRYCYVEFTMPATTVSHCVMRSVSITSDEPPEKYVRYLARHEYRVEMEFSSGTGPNEYIAATAKTADQLAKEEAAKKQQEMQQQQQNNDSSSEDSS